MITPADIENKDFSRVKKGYSPEEVDDFLDLIILDMEKLIRENRQLKEELGKAHVRHDGAHSGVLFQQALFLHI